MAKRKTPTSDPGEIRNPVKAAMLIAKPNGHLPYKVTRRADGVRCVFFHPTPEFLRDSKTYNESDLMVPGKRFILIQSRLVDLEKNESLDVQELVRAAQY